MSENSTFHLILVPSLVTLAVTMIRVAGEMLHGPELLFNRESGAVGITWLAFLVAVYFAVRLQNAGEGPARPGRAVALTALSLGVAIGGNLLLFPVGQGKGNGLALAGGMAICIASLYVMRAGWPAYGNAMIAYAVAARVPVAVISLAAVYGSWGTHYDTGPSDMRMYVWPNWVEKWVGIALLPQIFFWIPFTVSFCGLFGAVTAALRKRRAPAPAVSAG
jgi:uncharacterized membrane protein